MIRHAALLVLQLGWIALLPASSRAQAPTTNGSHSPTTNGSQVTFGTPVQPPTDNRSQARESQAAQSPGLRPTGWIQLPDCPVMVETAVDVPALEAGVIEKVLVELNDELPSNAPLAQLDVELAELDLETAKLQYDSARKLALDNSDIEFNRIALQEIEEELANYRSISTSVSDSELRRRKLSVEKAKLSLIQAEQAQARNVVDAHLKMAGVKAAEARLQRRTIKAPIQGVVQQIHRQAGQWVAAGEPIASVRNLEHLIVDRLVPLSSVNLAHIVGAEVRVDVPPEVTLTARQEPVRLSGRITSFDHAVSSQGHIRLHARVANIQEQGRWLLLPGMMVTMHIEAAHFHSLDPNDTRVSATPHTRQLR